MKRMSWVLLPVFLASLTGCYSPERIQKAYNTTLGQEIIDLKKALDQKAISEQQYQKLLEKLAEERLDVRIEVDEGTENDS